jgi:hypothetical protein
MERISIKRSLDSIDGKLINYLNSSPLGMSSTEAIMLALRAYWLPMALQKHQQSHQEVHSAAVWASSVLQAQVITISRIYDIERFDVVTPATPPVGYRTLSSSTTTLVDNDTVFDEDNGDDDEPMTFQPTEEMAAVYNALLKD